MGVGVGVGVGVRGRGWGRVRVRVRGRVIRSNGTMASRSIQFIGLHQNLPSPTWSGLKLGFGLGFGVRG